MRNYIGILSVSAGAVLSVTLQFARAAAPAPQPSRPDTNRVRPQDGVLVGRGVAFDAAKQVDPKSTAQVTFVGNRLQVAFSSAGQEQIALLMPGEGRWDLRDGNGVRIRVKNAGDRPITPRFQLLSGGWPTDPASPDTPVAPGEERELKISFMPAVPWTGLPNSGDHTTRDGQKGSGTKFRSDAVSAIRIAMTGEGKLEVISVVAEVEIAHIPDWLGKRPPVEGDWKQTLDEEFDGDAINSKIWNVYAKNNWDHVSHFSKYNTIVGDGVVRLRYEKKRGYQNDDPKPARASSTTQTSESEYATGYLGTFGKWTQRYGYFEARMKLPTAPGLWPAFWFMPDRGAGSPNRGTTADGGMEFDAMEHLTRWGPYRFNIAMHWDGYREDHKKTGTDKIYYQADEDGFITVGFLWTPGAAAYFCNGTEVASWHDDRISNVPSYLMFTLPSGGWDNDPLDDSRLPADFVIDYVRAWQRKDLAGTN